MKLLDLSINGDYYEGFSSEQIAKGLYVSEEGLEYLFEVNI